jgi:hypothetical protein
MDLNTQQIVLLCLLVAFVTSITTAISVVSLNSQNPEPVTQTINRVVEKTIERVVEPDGEENENNNETPSKPEKEVVTVVVNQEDLTIDSVQKSSKSLTRIHVSNKGIAGEFVTLGIAVSGDTIVVDKNMISKKGVYIAKTKIGELPVEILSYEDGSNFALLKLKDGKTGLEKAEFTDSNGVKLAQSVISLSGIGSDSVSVGVINKIDSFSKTEGENTWNEVTKIYTGVDPENITVGSLLINLSGKIVGFKSYDINSAKTTFLPSNVLRQFMSSKGL